MLFTNRHMSIKKASAPSSKTSAHNFKTLHAVAAAALLCGGLAQHPNALALALGRVQVQSALGEPLRAEIDVPQITPDEVASLKVNLASSDAFKAAGMEFNPALSGLQISLQKRSNGTSYLRVSSSRPVNEPFVDIILEAKWASGSLSRDYTLLLDPPKLRQAEPAPLAPQATETPRKGSNNRPVRPARAPAAAAAGGDAATGTGTGERQVRVKAGDTAGRIASANLPSNVSLDQMLVAMLKANPKAFIGDNVNRIKAGAVLELPDEATASAVTTGEAKQVITAQSRDFNEFRRRVADAVPAAAVGAADRSTSGTVQTQVEDKKPAAATQDKLTLSKGATAPSAAEDQIAKQREAKEATDRAAELARNIEDLNKLDSKADKAPGAPAAPAAGAEAGTTTTPAPEVTAPVMPATEPTTADVAPAPAAAEPAPPPAPEEPAAAKPAPAPAPAVPAPSFLSNLTSNPLVLPLAALLAALLGGFAFYRMRQQKKGPGVDSSFLESRLQPDSFFGSSGGQRIDTAESVASGSSMVYSPSQLDAAGDVDPVAEADVYLAYGRDLQAEEILKEAMRSTPSRVAIHNKLMEIYAKRRDPKAFEVVAVVAYGLTGGQGPEWEQACALGKELEPGNPLYQPGGKPPAKNTSSRPEGADTMPFGSSTQAQNSKSDTANASLDFDIDLDTAAPAAKAPSPIAAPAKAAVASVAAAGAALAGKVSPMRDAPDTAPAPMNFDLDFPSKPASLASALATPKTPDPALSGFDDINALSKLNMGGNAAFGDTAGAALSSKAGAADLDLMSFDLKDINLDLPEQTATAHSQLGGLSEENPLETKLSLAEEFRAIGDMEGARSLAEEVLAESSGVLKNKASTFLADLA